MLIVTDISKRKTHGYFENNRYVPVASPDANTISSATSRRLNKRPTRRLDAPLAQVDQIPTNAAGHRLDLLLHVPTSKERADYKSRTKSNGLCTSFHLAGYCYMKECRYDHGRVTPAQLHVLEHKLKKWPCYFKGNCRLKDCYHGHICIVRGCKSPKYKGCRLSSEAHNVDLEIYEWVKSVPRGHDRPEKRVGHTNISTTDSSKDSMENWPMMVTDLIEI